MSSNFNTAGSAEESTTFLKMGGYPGYPFVTLPVGDSCTSPVASHSVFYESDALVLSSACLVLSRSDSVSIFRSGVSKGLRAASLGRRQ